MNRILFTAFQDFSGGDRVEKNMNIFCELNENENVDAVYIHYLLLHYVFKTNNACSINILLLYIKVILYVILMYYYYYLISVNKAMQACSWSTCMFEQLEGIFVIFSVVLLF